MTGLVVGVIRMVLEFSYTVPSCGQPDGRPAVLADVHYLYFALILLALTCLIIVVISLATAPIPEEHVRNSVNYFSLFFILKCEMMMKKELLLSFFHTENDLKMSAFSFLSLCREQNRTLLTIL